MEESEGVNTEIENNNVGNIPERCTKSCMEAYETYWIRSDKPDKSDKPNKSDKPKGRPHYKGFYFVEGLARAFNKMDLRNTRCIEFCGELCDLFKKDENDLK